MKSVLLTHASAEYAALADLGEADKLEWCKRWNFDYLRLGDGYAAKGANRPAMWLDTLKRYDRMLFMGADTLITNLNIDPDSLEVPEHYDIAIAADGYGINCDVFMIDRNEETMYVLAYLREIGDKMGENEQEALAAGMADFLHYSEIKKLCGELRDGGAPASDRLKDCLIAIFNEGPLVVNLVDQRKLNAYPFGEYPNTKMNTSWHIGDFVFHCPGMEYHKRLRAMQNALTLVVR